MAAPSKRKASDALASSEDEDEAVSSYSPAFPLFDEADLIVKTADGTLFATRAVHLRSASSVFDNIIGMPVKDDQEKYDGLPLLKVTEKPGVFKTFLRYVQRDRFLYQNRPPKPKWHIIVKLISVFDKYDCPLLAHTFFAEHLPRFLGNPREPGLKTPSGEEYPIEVFAVATIQGLGGIARSALECFHYCGEMEDGLHSLSHRNAKKAKEMEEGWRPYGLGDLPIELLSKMSFKHIHRFSALHSKVVATPGYSWFDAAKDFKL